jgi:hypothetical protein
LRSIFVACAAAHRIIANPWLGASSTIFIILLSGVVFRRWGVADLVLQIVDEEVEVVDVVLVRFKSRGIHPFGEPAVLRVRIALKNEEKILMMKKPHRRILRY